MLAARPLRSERIPCCFNSSKRTVLGLEPKTSPIIALTLSIFNSTSTTNYQRMTIAGSIHIEPISLFKIVAKSTKINPGELALNNENLELGSSCSRGLCLCRRRRFIGASGAALLPIFPSIASELKPDQAAILERFHPPRPDWYEEFYALVLAKGMEAYEADVEGYKSELFSKLRGRGEKVLELGIGTGPNLKYYARDGNVHVYGVDPNKKMERYAREAAVAAGLPPSNFNFIHTVGEALPLTDASMDVVIGTLVLCSVVDVNLALEEVKRVLKPGGLYIFMEHVAAEDGTALRFLQGALDPLQQIVSDGCHLTRETGRNIVAAGFSGVDINMANISSVSLLSPHIYGIACK